MNTAATTGNQAPRIKWFVTDWENYSQQRLYVNGHQTPYFIQTGKTIGHRTQGDKYGLFGAGMSQRGCAAMLASGPRIDALKHRAEQFALERVAS